MTADDFDRKMDRLMETVFGLMPHITSAVIDNIGIAATSNLLAATIYQTLVSFVPEEELANLRRACEEMAQ